MTDVPTKISASQVSLILQRAAEIDARGDTLTVDELRRIAAEAGIDPKATSKAIQEVLADDDSGFVAAPPESSNLPAKRSTLPSPARIVTGGVIGTVLGFLASLANDVMSPDMFPMAWLAFGGTAFYLIVRAVQSMKRKTQLAFQLENFAVWFGGAVGGWAMDIIPPDFVLGMAFVSWFLVALVGGILVQFGPREEEEEGVAAPE